MKKYEMIFSELSIEEKIGQMFMIGFPGLTLPPDVQKFINDKNIGFIDIFARNVESVEQTTTLMNDLHAQAKIQPMIFTDQEGGVVCQFSELASTFPSQMGMAATANPAFIELAGEVMAEDMDLLGIDGFIAPSLDVNNEPDNPIIGLRSYSDDAKTVLDFGKAFIRGVHSCGLVAIPKHFPGHGGSRLDSHLVLPTFDASEEYYRLCDMFPFKSVAKEIDFMMTAHISIPQIDPSVMPATFSKKFLVDILRDEFGFNGVLITDCLEMDVIKNNYSAEEIIDNIIEAGIDVMLLSHSIDFQQELYNVFIEKVKSGIIPVERIDSSVKRILAMKEKYRALDEHKYRDVPRAVKLIRNKRPIEDLVTRHSIVMLRNKLNKIPLETNQKIGIIEWEKTRSTVELHTPTHTSYLEKFAKKYFDEVNVLILPLKKPDPAVIKEFLNSYENVIVAPFSRTPEVEMLQADMIREIIRVRDDVIIVATGNPYDIRHFQDAKTYLATFGFRDSQMIALMDNLTGKFTPQGKLPVEIKGIFPRWYNSNSCL
ncbi:MAG: glycoside hydrolase family 3 protein [Bacteroidota bacterium]|nr:glycoside hydrolase family 3 protein [Bacteroidota bacterium]MDP4196661.1 glycoside hydrolase family 3 protein [Bacteroidota bacterium]